MPLLRGRPIVVAVVLLGIGLLVAGAISYATAGASTFGWFGFAPAPDTISFEGVIVLDARRRLALVACVLGALLLSAAAGYAAGRRSATSPEAPTR